MGADILTIVSAAWPAVTYFWLAAGATLEWQSLYR
jgi:hypothetical protein